MKTLNDIARTFKVTPEQVQRQLERNARQLRSMERKARRTGGLVNDYSAEQLARLAGKAERFAEK